MEIPIPEVYVQVTQEDTGTQQYGVVDGQQRLRTILQFVGLETEQDQLDGEDNNGFALDALPSSSLYRDKTFAEIEGEARNRFFQYEICVRFLYTENTREIEDVFKRLNKFAMPLKSQELRNATYHGAFAKLSETLADDEYWAVNRIVSPAAIRRMSDIEMMSDLLIGLLHGPQGGSAKIIDEYYETYEAFEDEFPDQTRIKGVFDRALSCIQRMFPDISTTRWGNRTDFYSLFLALGSILERRVLAKSKERSLADELIGFADQVKVCVDKPTARATRAAKDYARAVEKGSNDKARRAARHEALMLVINSHLKDAK
jgi:hypothetical protein